MCTYWNTVWLDVIVSDNLSYTSLKEYRKKPIDTCIAPIVMWLNEHGFLTANCCCGHGDLGSIIFHDGIEIKIRQEKERGDIIV